MAMANQNIGFLKTAVLDADVSASIKLPDTGTLTGNTLVSTSAKYLRPGQGAILGSHSFSVASVNGNSVAVDAHYKDRMGNPGILDRADLYTDGALFRLSTCAKRTVFSVDPTGVPILHNGVPALKVADNLTIDHARLGFAVVSTGPTINFVFQSTSGVGIDKLGFSNSLHRLVVANQTGAELSIIFVNPSGVGPNQRVKIAKDCLSAVSIVVLDASSFNVYSSTSSLAAVDAP